MQDILNNLVKELRGQGWNVDVSDDKIEIYPQTPDNLKNQESTFICTKDELYYFIRGQKRTDIRLGDMVLNLLGFLCKYGNSATQKRKQSLEVRDRIENANSIQDVISEYKKHFSKEDIDRYFNMELNTTRDDSICIIEDDGVYDINYVLNDYQATLGRAVVDEKKYFLYSELFDIVYALKNFHDDCNGYLDKIEVSSSNLIRLLSIYQSGSQIDVENKKNMSSSIHDDELLKMIRNNSDNTIPSISNNYSL